MTIPEPRALLLASAVLSDAVLKPSGHPLHLRQIPDQLEPSEPGGSHRANGRTDVYSHGHPDSGVSSPAAACGIPATPLPHAGAAQPFFQAEGGSGDRGTKGR